MGEQACGAPGAKAHQGSGQAQLCWSFPLVAAPFRDPAPKSWPIRLTRLSTFYKDRLPVFHAMPAALSQLAFSSWHLCGFATFCQPRQRTRLIQAAWCSTRFHPTPWLNIRSAPWPQAMLPPTSHIRRPTYPPCTAFTVAAQASLSSLRLQLQVARVLLSTSSHRNRSHEVGRGRLHSQG